MTKDQNPSLKHKVELFDDKTLSDDDFVSSAGIKTPDTETTVPDEDEKLALRSKLVDATADISLRLHPLPERDGLIVSVSPSQGTGRVPCDIVLVLDISGSMGAKAPAPDNAEGEIEIDGLTVLDLLKQATKAIIETMGDNDRLGIVTFTDFAEIVLELTPMTKENKTEACEKLKRIRPLGLTNMWHGIMEGMSLLDDKTRPGCMPAMMVLTDGISNNCNPPQGFVNRLRTYDLTAPIHTFGFGSNINSSLLQSIAEVAGGNFAFISDASMLATVFIHAMAHLQSSYASTAKLIVYSPSGLAITEPMGDYVRKEESPPLDDQEKAHRPLTVSLGALQLAQSRDVLLKWSDLPGSEKAPQIRVRLECQPLSGSAIQLQASCTADDVASLPHEKILFHRNRGALCRFITSLAPIGRNSERSKIAADGAQHLQNLTDSVRRLRPRDPDNLALLEDLSDQMTLAVSKQYIETWGFHYLLSMYNAHFKQICTSFKDPGPQRYNQSSPVFQDAKNKLSDLFDKLPPPKPEVTVRDRTGQTRQVTMSMRRYHMSSNPCFAADCKVKLADGSVTSVNQLSPGAKLWTRAGVRILTAVLETEVEREVMCRIGDLLVTPWHPVQIHGTWAFPAKVSDSAEYYSGKIYSLMLQPDRCSHAHAVEVGGHVAVTLGHGVRHDPGDARAHPFFGDYECVRASMETLPISNGVFQCGGTKKHAQTGLVCGFVRADVAVAVAVVETSAAAPRALLCT